MYKDYSNSKTTEKELKNKVFEFVLSHTNEFNWMFETTFNYDIENFIKEINRNLLSKIKRMKVIESQKWKLPEKDILDNIETAFKSAECLDIIKNEILTFRMVESDTIIKILVKN